MRFQLETSPDTRSMTSWTSKTPTSSVGRVLSVKSSETPRSNGASHTRPDSRYAVPRSVSYVDDATPCVRKSPTDCSSYDLNHSVKKAVMPRTCAPLTANGSMIVHVTPSGSGTFQVEPSDVVATCDALRAGMMVEPNTTAMTTPIEISADVDEKLRLRPGRIW